MKKKLIVLCGALVVAVAAVSITVASRDVSPFSGMTKASVEALTQYEIGYEMIHFTARDYSKYCYVSGGRCVRDENGNWIEYEGGYWYLYGNDCVWEFNSSCRMNMPC